MPSAHALVLACLIALAGCQRSGADPHQPPPETAMMDPAPHSLADAEVRRFARAWIDAACGAGDRNRVRIELVAQGWGQLRLGRSLNGTELRLAGAGFAHGLATHADSEIILRSEAGFRRLRASVGIDDQPGLHGFNQDRPGRLEFAIAAGGRRLWTSRPVGISDPDQVDLAIDGARELRLSARARGGSIDFAHADWAGLEVELADGSPRRLGEAAPFCQVPLPDGPPLSFTVGGRPLRDLLRDWRLTRPPATAAAGSTTHHLAWDDPASGLELRLDLQEFADFPAVEWVAWLRNAGTADTPLIADIQALDAPWGAGGDLQALRSRGSNSSPDDFQYRSDTVPWNGSLRMGSTGGRSSNEWLPFFNLDGGGEGVVGAIGWTGQWTAEFARDGLGRVRLRAGLERTSLRLHPGEEIRTPRILLLPWRGEAMTGHNELRRFLVAHHTPRPGGRPLTPPFTSGSWGATPTGDQIANIALWQREGMPYETYWIDAGWYGPSERWKPDEASGAWYGQVGNWYPCPYAHPAGLKPVSDAAHAAGKRFLLWIEPERAVTGSQLEREHPEWLLGERRPGGNLLFDLGNPAARAWLTELVSGLITSQGIDVYRQDFNMEPLPFWRAADPADRQGMCEIRYITGLYAFWDELLARHPGLVIDNCASGGRRLDLETTGRCIPLWRSDYQCTAQSPDGAQAHTLGLSYWLPFHGTGVAGGHTRAGDTYNFRSHLCAALGVGGPPAGEIARGLAYPWDWQRRMCSDYLRARPLFSGDYHPLSPCTSDPRQWAALQMHRPDLGAGMVLAFRRAESPYTAATFRLHGLDDGASYAIEDADSGATARRTGRELREHGVAMQMDAPKQSRLLFYQRAR